jgi:hypothetical protein
VRSLLAQQFSLRWCGGGAVSRDPIDRAINQLQSETDEDD